MRPYSFREGTYPRASVEDASEHEYVVDGIEDVEGRTRVYDRPVRRPSENGQSNSGVLNVGSSSENNSNVAGYSMLHPDEEEQVPSPTQLSQFSPPPLTPGSLMSGVATTSFTQVTTVPSLKNSEAAIYAEVEEANRMMSVQDASPSVPPVSPNDNHGGTQKPMGSMWYKHSTEDLMPMFSLSQPIYHIPDEPQEYMLPKSVRSGTETAPKRSVPYAQQVRRSASQVQNSRMLPQLPSGLRTALV